MKQEKNATGNIRLYIGIAVFSLIWLFLSVITTATRRIDYNWDHFIVNLPEMMSWLDLRTDTLSPTFLFGKYINKPANPKITITALDELTLERYGWPIKRRYYGDVVDKLSALGVKSIAVDVILSEPDRDNPENDRHYVEAVARAGNVINLLHVDADTGQVKLPIKGLSKASALIAHPNVEKTMDEDGEIRRYLPFYGTDTDLDGAPDKWLTYSAAGLTDLRCGKECAILPVPSIGIAADSLYSGKPLSELLPDYKTERGLNYRHYISRKLHPGWDKNEKNVKISSFRHISVADILSDRLSAEEKESLKGGITLIGATAIGAFDHLPSPFMKQLPGVEVHATFIDNLLAGDFRRPLSTVQATLLMLLLPWLPVFLRRYSLKALISVSLSAMGFLLMLYIVLLSNCVLMPFASVFAALFLPFAYITADKGLAEVREKKWIKSTFGQYLSPKVVELITKDPSKLSLGGEKRDMTAFFLDIAGFTTMSEKMTPEQLTTMLNNYLSGLTDVILRNDGVVDKYIGDCIMAFWNAPLDQKDHRRLACLSAVECMDEIARLNTELTQFTIKPSARIGLNSGPMVVGNMGSKTRLSYTVMGDSVNLASRLEGANKYFHSKIMASEYTYDEAKDFVEARMLGQIRVVGKAIPVRVYELLAHKGKLSEEGRKLLAAYNDGYETFFKGDYGAAKKAFEAALALAPEDGPSKFYLDLTAKYAVEVPKGWDGTFNLTSK